MTNRCLMGRSCPTTSECMYIYTHTQSALFGTPTYTQATLTVNFLGPLTKQEHFVHQIVVHLFLCILYQPPFTLLFSGQDPPQDHHKGDIWVIDDSLHCSDTNVAVTWQMLLCVMCAALSGSHTTAFLTTQSHCWLRTVGQPNMSNVLCPETDH